VTAGGRRLPVASGRAAGSAPAFQRIAIVGLGAVGGSLAIAVRRVWPETLVIGVDTHDVIETAIRMHAIDVGSDDLVIAAEADLVVLAGGPDENARVMRFLADALPGESTVLALGGVGAGADGAEALPGRFALAIGLPAVEVPAGGIRAAGADLFRGRRWTLVPVTAHGGVVDRLQSLVRAVGGEPVAGAARAE